MNAAVTVVVAEDNALVRRAICHQISHSQCLKLVAEAADGQEAWSKLQATRPNVLVTDLRMPFMDGLTLTQRLRELQHDTRVILVTTEDQLTPSAALQAGARGFLLKTDIKQELEAAICQVAEGDLYLSPRFRTPTPASEHAHECQQTLPAGIQGLSDSELRLLLLLAQGHSMAQCATLMDCETQILSGYRKRLLTQLNLASTGELLLFAAKLPNDLPIRPRDGQHQQLT